MIGRVGVIFAGQNSIAAGILNVVNGLFAYLKRNEEEGKSAEIFGYIGGPYGFLEGRYRRINKWTQIRTWLNQGGCAAFSYSASPSTNISSSTFDEGGDNGEGIEKEEERLSWYSMKIFFLKWIRFVFYDVVLVLCEVKNKNKQINFFNSISSLIISIQTRLYPNSQDSNSTKKNRRT